MINIDRCYCEDKTFQSLLDIARRQSLDLPALARQEGCGTHCGWCVAYLRRGLQTGEVAFGYLLDKEPIEPDTSINSGSRLPDESHTG